MSPTHRTRLSLLVEYILIIGLKYGRLAPGRRAGQVRGCRCLRRLLPLSPRTHRSVKLTTLRKASNKLEKLSNASPLDTDENFKFIASIIEGWTLVAESSQLAVKSLEKLHDLGNRLSPYVDGYLIGQISSALANVQTTIRIVGRALDEFEENLEARPDGDDASLCLRTRLAKWIDTDIDPLEQVWQSTYILNIILRTAELWVPYQTSDNGLLTETAAQSIPYGRQSVRSRTWAPARRAERACR